MVRIGGLVSATVTVFVEYEGSIPPPPKFMHEGGSSVGRLVTQEGTLEEPCHRAITCCEIISYTIVFKEIITS